MIFPQDIDKLDMTKRSSDGRGRGKAGGSGTLKAVRTRPSGRNGISAITKTQNPIHSGKRSTRDGSNSTEKNRSKAKTRRIEIVNHTPSTTINTTASIRGLTRSLSHRADYFGLCSGAAFLRFSFLVRKVKKNRSLPMILASILSPASL